MTDKTSFVFHLLSPLLSVEQFPVTELAPPPQRRIVAEYEALIPVPDSVFARASYSEAKKLYAKLLFNDPWIDGGHGDKNTSWYEMLTEILNGKLINLEEKLYKKLENKYRKEVDEVDQATLSQFYSIGHWVYKKYGPAISRKCVEGKFVSLNEQGNYKAAANFAWKHMWQLNDSSLAHRSFIASIQGTPLLASHTQGAQEKIDVNEKMLKIWQLRWEESRKMDAFITYFRDYQFIWQQLVRDPKLAENITENAMQKYPSIVEKAKLANLIAELNASYLNMMLQTKQQSTFSKYAQDGLNYVAHKISLFSGEIKEPRHWDELKIIAERYIEKTMQNLPQTYQQKFTPEEAFKTYIQAVEEDRFIYAKWLTQTIVSEVSGDNLQTSDKLPTGSRFNWQTEKTSFDNYRRSVMQLLEIYEHVGSIMQTIMQLQTEVFKIADFTEKKLPNPFMDAHGFIKQSFLFLREIDSLRIQMRLGYLKKIKTDINIADIDLFSRISNSMNAKLHRYFMEGNIVDKTTSYQETSEILLPQIFMKFDSILSSYGWYLERLKGKVKVATLQEEVAQRQQQFADNKRFYPIFFDFEKLKSYVETAQYSDRALNIFLYNLKYQLKNSRGLKISLSKGNITKFIEQMQRLSGYYDRLIQLNKTIASEHRHAQTVKKLLQSCFGTRAGLYDSFVKYYISQQNSQESLTLGRVISSAVRKATRVCSIGQISDQTPSYPDVIKETEDTILNLEKGVSILENLSIGHKDKKTAPQQSLNDSVIIDDYMTKIASY
ncbi:hypothetical protein [Candidatus Paracaedibacter symbiosus]|uniref:hypothetical protein n=1 Tax=Candidatus Paracaedibacter symbiosus TaxID=244582 RepID=UPI000509FC02|nr:hypothetical protein [Candidatus Paracaedibacter symbiosus]